ncbi:MAG: GMC family oxidoreductase [Actinomycetota bacterium]|nr:GMC family oxidoreductase [Actinomycetota bacterium]
MRRIATGYEARKRPISWPRLEGPGPLVSVHPLGGVRIGRTADEGVVDHTGQVFGHPRLYVADGSLYPRAPGIPPSMTIAALAERQAELLE